MRHGQPAGVRCCCCCDVRAARRARCRAQDQIEPTRQVGVGVPASLRATDGARFHRVFCEKHVQVLKKLLRAKPPHTSDAPTHPDEPMCCNRKEVMLKNITTSHAASPILISGIIQRNHHGAVLFLRTLIGGRSTPDFMARGQAATRQMHLVGQGTRATASKGSNSSQSQVSSATHPRLFSWRHRMQHFRSDQPEALKYFHEIRLGDLPAARQRILANLVHRCQELVLADRKSS